MLRFLAWAIGQVVAPFTNKKSAGREFFLGKMMRSVWSHPIMVCVLDSHIDIIYIEMAE